MASARRERRNIFCSKVVLLIFNFGFFLAGLIVGLGAIWCLTGIGQDILIALTPSSSSPTLVHLAYGLLGIGAFVLAVVTLGTWSTLRESQCGLAFYLSFVTLVVIGEVSLGILAIFYQAKATSEVTATLSHRLQHHYAVPTREHFTIAIDFIQYQLQCCGINSPKDWEESQWKIDKAGGPDRIVPLTCCALQPESKAYLNPNPVSESNCQNSTASNSVNGRHQQGCMHRVRGWIKGEAAIIIGVGIGVAIMQLAGLIAAASLCRALRSMRD